MPEALEQKITEHEIEARLQFLDERKLPAVITSTAGESLHSMLTTAREPLAAIRLRYGAILFRGFDLRTPEALSTPQPLSASENGLQRLHREASALRGQVLSGVYESTRFPAHLRIPQHNEMSYLPDPPRELAFFCEVEPQHGGENPVSRLPPHLQAKVPAEVRAVSEASGISYHRYLYGPCWNIHHLTRNRFVSNSTPHGWLPVEKQHSPPPIPP